jgi:hypothetical protein
MNTGDADLALSVFMGSSPDLIRGLRGNDKPSGPVRAAPAPPRGVKIHIHRLLHDLSGCF